MNTACYDKRPEPPRHPIAIAGDLVRRSDKLSIEAAKCLRDTADKLDAAERERDGLRSEAESQAAVIGKLIAESTLAADADRAAIDEIRGIVAERLVTVDGELSRLKEALPKTADGVVILPGMEVWWVYESTPQTVFSVRHVRDECVFLGGETCGETHPGDIFSTREAFLAYEAAKGDA